MINTHNKGEIAVLKCELRANEKGFIVSYPRNQHTRYDALVDDGIKIHKTQIKYLNRKVTGKRSKTLQLLLYDDTGLSSRRPYSREEIDLLLIYCPIIDKVLIFNADFFNNKKTININLENKEADMYYEKFLW